MSTARRFALLGITLALFACSGLSKLDYTKLGTRATWQHPDRVIESLGIQSGDRVADIGAGDGYFVTYLADAVGPEGKVYAVEVEQEKADVLEKKVRDKGYSNVVVVLGQFGDPLLPDKSLDLVFLCNTYHHIEDRPDYFSRVHSDLRREGRVAIIDMKDDLTGILGLFTDEEHWTPLALLVEEMGKAGYRPSSRFDFLPVQNFVVFEPDS